MSAQQTDTDTLAYRHSPYFHVGRADDLSGSDYWLYRALEILPGFLSWLTILGTFFLSYFFPVFAACFIIFFDLYWLLKTLYLSIHLRHNWKRIRFNMKIDWQERMSGIRHEHFWHLIVLPYYNESLEIVDGAVGAIRDARGDTSKMIVVLAGEERAGQESVEVAEKIKQTYAGVFAEILHTSHPANVVGEMPGKGSNASYALEEARKHVLDKRQIPYEDVIVSNFDIDTVVPLDYFLCLTWHFATATNPYKTSFQPVPLYNNNIWQAPAFSRVVAMSSTFWQMVQQERPEKLATFSSHSTSFRALYEVGYWQKNIVSEDSRIFWNLFLAHDGDYKVTPLSFPVSMDANLAPTFTQTLRNIYKQHRRWAWGVENVPYILFGFIKNKRIPFRKKASAAFVQLEGFWSLATNPLIIFLLGWLPLMLGGDAFRNTVLSRNLPVITRDLMILSMCGLILSTIISLTLIPPPPPHLKIHHRLFMILQWILVPITIVVFGALPGLDAQTRLMTKRYLGFWVTPKHRK